MKTKINRVVVAYVGVSLLILITYIITEGKKADMLYPLIMFFLAVYSVREVLWTTERITSKKQLTVLIIALLGQQISIVTSYLENPEVTEILVITMVSIVGFTSTKKNLKEKRKQNGS